MLNRGFLRGVRSRVFVAMALLGVSYWVDTSRLEQGWSKLIAWATSDASYVTFGRNGDKHGVRFELPEGIYVRLSSGKLIPRTHSSVYIARACTYISLAAILLPFMIRTLSIRSVLTGTVATVMFVGLLNFGRLELCTFLDRAGWGRLWRHDIPHYACYTLSILGAVWYYYRSTVPRDAGGDAEAAADGSAQTVNA